MSDLSLQSVKDKAKIKGGITLSDVDGYTDSYKELRDILSNMDITRRGAICPSHVDASLSNSSLRDLEKQVDDSNTCTCNGRTAAVCDCASRTYGSSCYCNSRTAVCSCVSRTGEDTCNIKTGLVCWCRTRTATDIVPTCDCNIRTYACVCDSRTSVATCDCNTRTAVCYCASRTGSATCTCNGRCSCNTQSEFL